MNHYTYRSMLLKQPKQPREHWILEGAVIIGCALLLVVAAWFATHLWDIHAGEVHFYEGKVESKYLENDVVEIHVRCEANKSVILRSTDESDFYRIEVGQYYNFGTRGEEKRIFGWKPYICRIKKLEGKV